MNRPMQTEHKTPIDALAVSRQLNCLYRQLAENGDFALALRQLKTMPEAVLKLAAENGLEALESDYRLMCDFMLRGFADPQRPALYHRLASRMDILLHNVQADVLRTCEPFFSSLCSATSTVSADAASVRLLLEKHVQEVAMLSLDDDDRRADHARQIHETHFANMRNLFNATLLSHQWTADEATQMVRVLTAPTIDVADALLMVSAVTMALMVVPDAQKVVALTDIYATADDLQIRQRALVGWALAVGTGEYRLATEVNKRIDALLGQPEARTDVLQLEKQMVFCLNAEHDQQTLRNDIMPNIIKHRNIDAEGFGIIDKHDDSIDDLLHPDADDKKMEQLEQNFQRLQDMQKRGVDIYFGGFSQMKRFSFFYTLCNWFMPFNIEHPQLQHLSQPLLQSQFLQSLMQDGPFCDSDKYSFALAFSSVYTRLPENIRSMMESGALKGMAEEQQTTNSEAYIRRKYLQDLYRFFKIHDHRGLFTSPFDDNSCLLLDLAKVAQKMPDEVRSMRRFLVSQKMFRRAARLSKLCFDPSNIEDLRLTACVATHCKQYKNAYDIYNRLLSLLPDDQQAMRSMAQVCFWLARYDEAESLYRQLLQSQPDDARILLRLAIAQLNNGQAEEAKKELYKLLYNDPDNPNVKRALAWAELWLKNTDAAHKIYTALLAQDDHRPADAINAGYCCLFSGQVEEAVGLMARGIRETESPDDRQSGIEKVQSQFVQDKALLERFAVSDTDRLILTDLVASSL